MLMTVVKFEDVVLLSSHLKQHYGKESHISFKNKTHLQNNKWQKTALELFAESGKWDMVTGQEGNLRFLWLSMVVKYTSRPCQS